MRKKTAKRKRYSRPMYYATSVSFKKTQSLILSKKRGRNMTINQSKEVELSLYQYSRKDAQYSKKDAMSYKLFVPKRKKNQTNVLKFYQLWQARENLFWSIAKLHHRFCINIHTIFVLYYQIYHRPQEIFSKGIQRSMKGQREKFPIILAGLFNKKLKIHHKKQKKLQQLHKSL